MKNSIVYLFIVALLFTSCKEVPDVANNEEHKDVVEESISAKNDDSDTSCIAYEKIYPQTAWVWAESWVAAYNYVYKDVDSVSKAPELIFKNDRLDRLQSINKSEATGVLLYYILEDEETKIPSLAMLNMINCNLASTECTDCVLVSRHDTISRPIEKDFISYSSFETYKKNWIKADKKREGYIPVNAYNYSWTTLNNLRKYKEGVLVKYGARTIDISENNKFNAVNDSITGNVVACNVLVGLDNDYTSFEETLRNMGVAEELDFAMPCPEYCGGSQQ